MFGIESERKPTLLFELPRTLFRFSAQTPAVVPLFQLLPEITQSMSNPHRIRSPRAVNIVARGRMAKSLFLEPSANHAAQLIDATRDHQKTVAARCLQVSAPCIEAK
jgi:hypothetical protein